MRTVVIGDTHGCLQELDDLLAHVGHRRDADRLVFVGDLLDRGPDSVGVVRRVRELGAECVMGNHEEGHLRYHRYENIQRLHGVKNPMRPYSAHKRAIQAALSEDDWAFLGNLPFYVRLGPALCVVHAGCQPGIAVEAQEQRVLQRVRYLRADGKMLKLEDDTTGASYWSMVWTGPDSIVYGHHPMDKVRPAVDEPAPGVFCYGIDTGCCFGGHLSAAIFEDGAFQEFASIKARQAYVTQGDG